MLVYQHVDCALVMDVLSSTQLATQHDVVMVVTVNSTTTSDSGADIGPLGRSFAREVRRRRELRGLSQTDLAYQLREQYGLKFHQATIDRVEKAVRPCRLDEVFAIAEVLGSSLDDMLNDWSTTERAWRQLAGIALRAREAEARIALAVQQNLETVQGDRQRLLAGLEQRGELNHSDEVEQWANEVLSDLDRIWSWAGELGKANAATAAVPTWVSDVLHAPSQTLPPDEQEV